MLGPILASLKDIEIERVEEIFEYIALMSSLGKIDYDAAVQLIQLEADMKFYESIIGRNTNFRYSDHSSVFNNPFRFDYFKRLFQKEGEAAVQKVRNNKITFQVQTHDTLGLIDPFFTAFGSKLYVLEMIRHPIDLIYSWFRRGWGERWANDPLSMTVTANNKGEIVPWYFLFIDEDYSSLVPMDRILIMINVLQRRVLDKYESLSESQRKQILWISFDDFVTNSNDEIKHIETFLNSPSTSKTKNTMKKENCPRVIKEADRDGKFDVIKKNTQKLHLVEEIFNSYEKAKGIIEWQRTNF